MGGLGSQIAIYGGARFLEKALPFLVLPILSSLVSEADFGKYILFQTIFILFGYISQFGSESKYAVDFDGIDQLDKIFQSQAFSVVTSVLSFLISALLYYLFIDFSFENDINITIVVVFNLSLLLRSWLRIRLVHYQFEKRPFSFAKLQISNSLLKNTLSLVFVVLLDHWHGMVYGLALGNFISVVFNERLRDFLSFNLSLKRFKPSLKYGLPIALNGLCGWLITSSSKIIVSSNLGVEILANFGILTLAQVIMMLFGEVMSTVFIPDQYRIIKLFKFRKAKKIYYLSMWKYFGLVLASTVLMLFSTEIVLNIFFKNYHNQGIIITSLIVLSGTMNALYKWPVGVLFVRNKTTHIFGVLFLTGLITLAMSITLITPLGVLGVSIAMFVGQLIPLILVFVLSIKFSNEYSNL